MDTKSLKNSSSSDFDDLDDMLMGSPDDQEIIEENIEKHTLSKRRQIEELLEKRRLQKILGDFD